MPPFKPPSFQVTAFNCPLCTAFAKQSWQTLFRQPPIGQMQHIPTMLVALCDHCNNLSVWLNQNMVFPNVSTAPLANPDLPEDVKRDYDDAREILDRSPRGAAALLHLAVQKFCKNLGEKGTNINDDIAELVKKGLPLRVQ